MANWNKIPLAHTVVEFICILNKNDIIVAVEDVVFVVGKLLGSSGSIVYICVHT